LILLLFEKALTREVKTSCNLAAKDQERKKGVVCFGGQWSNYNEGLSLLSFGLLEARRDLRDEILIPEGHGPGGFVKY
ncbi:hypothetical protein AVEN_166464-1, partial [Araneus ventricosus]